MASEALGEMICHLLGAKSEIGDCSKGLRRAKSGYQMVIKKRLELRLSTSEADGWQSLKARGGFAKSCEKVITSPPVQTGWALSDASGGEAALIQMNAASVRLRELINLLLPGQPTKTRS